MDEQKIKWCAVSGAITGSSLRRAELTLSFRFANAVTVKSGNHPTCVLGRAERSHIDEMGFSGGSKLTAAESASDHVIYLERFSSTSPRSMIPDPDVRHKYHAWPALHPVGKSHKVGVREAEATRQSPRYKYASRRLPCTQNP